MKLCDLLRDVQGKHLSGPADTEILNVCYDSRKVNDGSLFLAIKGFRSDGHQYIEKALELGASALLVQDAPAVSARICASSSRTAVSMVD